MMENIVLKEKLEKLFDRLTTEIVYTAWMNRIKFKDKSITSAVYEIGNIEYCNIVMQNDEIGS